MRSLIILAFAATVSFMLLARVSGAAPSSATQIDCRPPGITAHDILVGFQSEGPKPLAVGRLVSASTRPNQVRFNLTYVYRRAETTEFQFVLFVRGLVEIPSSPFVILRLDSTLCSSSGQGEMYAFSRTYRLPIEEERALIEVPRPLAQTFIDWLRTLGASVDSELLTPQIRVGVDRSFIEPGRGIPQIFPLGIIDRPIKGMDWLKAVDSFVLVPPQ